METTFVLKKDELDNDFIKNIKSLFKKTEHLQITVSTAEDFELLQTESPKQYISRLEKCMSEIKLKKKQVVISEEKINELLLNNF